MANDGGSVDVVALDGIPEVDPGDDLGELIGAALERRPDLLPLTDSTSSWSPRRSCPRPRARSSI